MAKHQTRVCQRDDCRLRFPVPENSELGERCPHCQGATVLTDLPYLTHEARGVDEVTGPPLEVFLDNVRSLRNVGAVFRTADGAGVRHVYLGGFTPTPEHPKMAKTSLGAEASVPWSRHVNGLDEIERLVQEGTRVWALEGGPQATPIRACLSDRGDAPIVLVLGHEVSGIDPRILARCERTVRLPMQGVKGSLNVSVAFGIAAYFLRFG
ncbi:MAG: RNA methyltransferase [Nannocystaceae bacterium]